MTKKLIILFALIGISFFAISANKASAIISLNASSTSGQKVNVNNWTFAHTVAAGSDISAIVAVKTSGVTTGITFNGSAMTFVASSSHAGYGYTSWMYSKTSPSTGNIIVTFAANSYGEAIGWTFNGTNTASLIDTIATSSAAVRTATPSSTITTSYNYSYLIDNLGISYNESGICDPPQIKAADGTSLSLYTSSYKDTTTAGTYKMSWNSVTEPTGSISQTIVAIRTKDQPTKRRIFISLDQTLKSLALLIKNSLRFDG